MQDLFVPRRDAFGDVVWRRPTVSSVGAILKNPAYAGSFVYGRTRTVRTGPDHTPVQKPLPIAEWRIHIRDMYPPYIDWATFETIQAMIRDNHSEYDRNKTRGVPAAREGPAPRPRPLRRVRPQDGRAVQGRDAISVQFAPATVPGPGLPAPPGRPDRRLRRAASSSRRWPPPNWTSTTGPWPRSREEREQVRRARRQQLERLRYQARLAERQYQKADPDNRLVAAELERRWEIALRELKQAEEALERSNMNMCNSDQLDPETRRMLTEAGRQIPEWWQTDRFSREQKKALLRCLIDKVVVHRIAPDRVHCRVVWKGARRRTPTSRSPSAPGHASRQGGRSRSRS